MQAKANTGAGPAEAAYSFPVEVSVNGEDYVQTVAARRLLVHFLRDDLNVNSANVGCDTGNCGACTILLDDKLVKSCMVLAVQAGGAGIETVESLAAPDEELHPIQRAFSEHHGLQCGYCTPGMLLSAKFLLGRTPSPTDEEVRRGIKGNLCRCTGYENIITAVQAAGREM